MISVVIPMYNASKTIIECLQSVLQQTYKGDTEIIIVNDGSTDGSLNLVVNYCKTNELKNVITIDKDNGGVSSARNAGMQIAKGDFIALLDADDQWLPTKLERQMDVLSSNKAIDFLGCSRNNEVLSILSKKITTLHKATAKQLLIKTYPQTSTAIFKRALYEKFGGYNESMTHCEDANLWVRYCHNSNFYYLPESLVITGGGKPNFGHSGLSANLKEMEKGHEFTLIESLRNGIISFPLFCTLYIFAKVKYLRRILITNYR